MTASPDRVAPTAAETAVAEPGRTIELPAGLPGFPGATRFRLSPLDGAAGPFWLLRSTDDAGLGLVVAPLAPEAGLIEPADIERGCHDLGLAADAVLVLLVLNPQPKDGGGVEVYANLRAPLLIDPARGIGHQHVLPNPRYPIRHRLA